MESIKKFKKFKLNSQHLIYGGNTSGSGCCSTNQQLNYQNLCPGSDTDHQTWSYTDNCGGGNYVRVDGPIRDGGCK
jgi:hypothetical protein